MKTRLKWWKERMAKPGKDRPSKADRYLEVDLQCRWTGEHGRCQIYAIMGEQRHCAWHYECSVLGYFRGEFEVFEAWLRDRAERYPTDKWKRYTSTSLWGVVNGKTIPLALRAEHIIPHEDNRILDRKENLQRVGEMVRMLTEKMA